MLQYMTINDYFVVVYRWYTASWYTSNNVLCCEKAIVSAGWSEERLDDETDFIR